MVIQKLITDINIIKLFKRTLIIFVFTIYQPSLLLNIECVNIFFIFRRPKMTLLTFLIFTCKYCYRDNRSEKDRPFWLSNIQSHTYSSVLSFIASAPAVGQHIFLKIIPQNIFMSLLLLQLQSKICISWSYNPW